MRDALGNELKVGDLVAIQLARPLIYGRVAEITDGGIITGTRNGQAQVRPTRIMVVSNHPIEVDPRIAAINEVVCLRDDQAQLAAPEESKGEALPN